MVNDNHHVVGKDMCVGVSVCRFTMVLMPLETTWWLCLQCPTRFGVEETLPQFLRTNAVTVL
jgi:hypothetical protein